MVAQAPSDSDPILSLSLFELGKRYCDIAMAGKPTQSYARFQLKHITEAFRVNGLPSCVGEIKAAHVNAYRLYRLGQVASATCRHDLIFIGRIFNWARREYLVDLPNPVKDIQLPANSKPRNKVVTRAELIVLLEALTPVMRAVVELAYETAMRRSEILKLTPRHLNLAERTVSVIDGKTGDRLVPLTLRAVELLADSARKCRPDQRLFPVAPLSVTQAVRRARRQVGLSDDVRLHQLRHTRITEVARRGFNQAQIMMVSGHRDVRSVQRYTHLSVKDVVGLLDS
ncbi:MAG: site-specific integrase [Candidatus Zixiibacteriota bacterium]